MLTTEEDKDTKTPDSFKLNKSQWRLVNKFWKKPFCEYDNDPDAIKAKTGDTKNGRMRTQAEADTAWVLVQAGGGSETNRPAMLDMTEDELKELPDFDAQAPNDPPEPEQQERADQRQNASNENTPPKNESTSSRPNYDALLAAAVVRPTDVIVDPPVCLTIDQDGQQSIIGTLGNISAVIGKAKARKTFAASCAIAAAVACKLILNRINGSLPTAQGKVLLFDTEQSKYHVLKVLKRICRLIDIEEPQNLTVYSLREFPPNERLALIDHALTHTEGIGMVIIDGIRDLQVDPILDAAQANIIITYLLQWTTKLNIHILTLLHQNKTDGNARGHIGTELINKAETVITITKDREDKEISIVAPEHCREKEFEPFAFSVDEQGIPFFVKDWQTDQRPASRRTTKTDEPPKTARTITPSQLPTDTHECILRRAFANVEPDKYGATCHRIKAAAEYFGYKFGDNRAKEFMTFYVDEGLLNKVGNTYALTLNPVNTSNIPP